MRKKYSRLGLGCFGIGGPFEGAPGFFAYGEVDDEESKKTILKAIEMGVTVLDTADVYGHGRSERVIGEIIKDYRDDLVILTKFGSVFKDKWLKLSEGKNTTREYIVEGLDDSMERLQTDYIDVYQLHNSKHDVADIPRIIEILEDLVQEGRIGGYGWSTDQTLDFEVMAKQENSIGPQFALTVMHRNPGMIEILEKYNKYGFIRSPLASGTHTTKYSDPNYTIKDSKHMLNKVDFKSERAMKIKQKFEAFSEIIGDERTRIQGILGYLMAKSPKIIPIPGAKTVAQITENAKTLELGALNQSQVNQIDALFEDMAVDTFKGIVNKEK